ncbi:UNVERIFIED_CONTAM: spore cortex formation protein SpoVR/YcgB (stage V sporulation) [Brevibacillus sp. OAP136]
MRNFEDIERRNDNPTKEEQERFGRKPGKWREKLFEVWEIESDISFIRNYLTKDLVNDLDMYMFGKQGNDWVVQEKAWEQVRDGLANTRVNGGFPYMTVMDADYLCTGGFSSRDEKRRRLHERSLPPLLFLCKQLLGLQWHQA